MNDKEKQFLLDVALLTSKRSKAIRTKVGGVIADANGNIVCVGYNGSIAGSLEPLEHRIYERDETGNFDRGPVDKVLYPYHEESFDGKDHYRLVTNENVTIHCEQNLIAHAARRGISIDGGTALLTLSPCTKCTSLLIQCGIKEIIFLEKYRKITETEALYGKHIKLTHWSKS